MNQGVFWGVMIIFFGLILLVKQMFHLEFPVIKVFIGVFLVMLGIKLLFFRTFTFNNPSKGGDVVFGSKEMNFITDIKEYNTVFGSLELDMRDLKVSPQGQYEINAVFGETTVILNNNTKVNLRSDVVLGSVEGPKPIETFEFESVLDSTIVEVEIKASAVFGSISFKRK